MSVSEAERTAKQEPAAEAARLAAAERAWKVAAREVAAREVAVREVAARAAVQVGPRVAAVVRAVVRLQDSGPTAVVKGWASRIVGARCERDTLVPRPGARQRPVRDRALEPRLAARGAHLSPSKARSTANLMFEFDRNRWRPSFPCGGSCLDESTVQSVIHYG